MINNETHNRLPASVGKCGKGYTPAPCIEMGELWSTEDKCVYKARVLNARDLNSLTVRSLKLSCDDNTGIYSLSFQANLGDLCAYLQVDECLTFCICASVVNAPCGPGSPCDVRVINLPASGTFNARCAGGALAPPIAINGLHLGEIDVVVDMGAFSIRHDISPQITDALVSQIDQAINANHFPCPGPAGPSLGDWHHPPRGNTCTLVQYINAFHVCVA